MSTPPGQFTELLSSMTPKQRAEYINLFNELTHEEIRSHLERIRAKDKLEEALRENAALRADQERSYAALKAYELLDDRHANCPDCDGEDQPEACETCFPFADSARLKMRDCIARIERAKVELETYEAAVQRTGRKWPYRTEEWPCPACGKADCDQDIVLSWKGRRRGILTFCYAHVEATARKAENPGLSTAPC